MKNHRLSFRTVAIKTAFASLSVLLLSTSNPASARPSFRGHLGANADAFNAFMRRSVGKTIDLDITFESPARAKLYESGAEPYTSLGGDTGPIFTVKDNLFRVENGGNERTWRRIMGYDKARRRLRGTFGVMTGQKSGESTGYNFDLRFRPRFKRDVKVHVVDERGRILLRTSGLTLPDGAILLPVAAYASLGLDVERKIERGVVALASPGRLAEKSEDSTDFDIVYNSVTHHPKGSEKKLYADFKSAFVLLQNGEFFVPASLVQRRFIDKLSTTWNGKTRSMTLRRSQGFADYLDYISEVA